MEALRAPQPGTVTEPLEPETVANLRALILDHTAFINGFAAGRELRARAQAIHEVNRSIEEIKQATAGTLRPMLTTKRLLAQKAQGLIGSLVRAFEDLDTRAIGLISSGSETAKNSLIAFGRAIHPIIVLSEGTAMIAILMNSSHPEILKAALIYLRDNAESITAFAASDPELSRWIVWLIDRTKKFLDEFGEKLNR